MILRTTGEQTVTLGEEERRSGQPCLLGRHNYASLPAASRLLLHEMAEGFEIRRLLSCFRAQHGTEPLPERLPFHIANRYQFAIRVQTLLRHIMQKVPKPFRRCACARREDCPDARGSVVGSGDNSSGVDAKLRARHRQFMTGESGQELAAAGLPDSRGMVLGIRDDPRPG